jgi:RHS repeat-associated protein
MTVALLAGSTPAIAAPVAVPGHALPAVQRDRSVEVHPVASHYQRPRTMPAAHPATPRWPTGTGEAVLPGDKPNAAPPRQPEPRQPEPGQPEPGQPEPGQPEPGDTGPGAAAAGAAVRAGSLPVWLVPGPATSTTRLRVDAAPVATARAAGITGMLLSARRTDGSSAAGRARIVVSYRNVQDAYGADWAARLHLVTLPRCALTTPARPQCRTRTPLKSGNDNRAGTLTADLTLPALASGDAGPAVVVAAVSEPGGGAGDFGATSLQPAGSWQAGGASGAFTWTYPIPVPAVPGGLVPNITLGYNSQAQDGLTSSTNNQPSWLGDGWTYSPGYIERAYQSCHENPAGPTRTSDNCWTANNTLTLSLNGSSSTLVQDGNSEVYHPENDANEKVEHLSGAANGAHDGEYWRITTADGTQYYFGISHVPGWTAGKAETNSALTEPVFSTAAGQPCFNSSFAQSFCPDMAYRWNLDHVVDTHSDVITYFYKKETNSYARGGGSTANAPYVRGSYLDRIQYGQRKDEVFTTTPAGQVQFTVKGRCDTSATGCELNTLSSTTAAHWPDVPYDLNCADGATNCPVDSPSFWSTVELTGIQTSALAVAALANVDAYALTHEFPATGDATKPSLWLKAITHTGQDTTAGGSAAITLPPITFAGQPLSNRVKILNGHPPITRHRLTDITTETGEKIAVTYSAAACATCVPADPATNTSRTFPGYWTPTGQSAPILDWFNKFIVTTVTQDDPTGGNDNDAIATTYAPVGGGAWRRSESPTTPAARRTWDQWRGYGGMIVTTGSGPVLKTQYSYFRGMGGTIVDSRNDPAVTDANQFAGMTYETRVFDGNAVVSDAISEPWTSAATGSHTYTGLPAQQSFHLGTASTRTYVPLAAGGTRETRVNYRHDSRGRVDRTEDLADTGTAGDDLCSTVEYTENTGAWILDRTTRTTAVAAGCASAATPQNTVADAVAYYDGASTAAAPTIGDVTTTKAVKSYDADGNPVYATMSSAVVDGYGRPTSVTDAANRTVTTAYTPAAGAQPTSIAVRNTLMHLTTTAYDPLRALPTQVTDPGGYVTARNYDALGRVSAVWKPGRSKTSTAHLKYAYTISNSGPSVVTTSTLNEDATTYRVSETLYDSLLRARETQTQTPDGFRTITDTIYNGAGQVAVSTAPYFNQAAVSPTYVQAQPGQVDAQTSFDYDGAGRKTAEIAYERAVETWRTTYRYSGDVITVLPPAGASATSTFVDARGRTTGLYQYHDGIAPDPVSAAAGDYDRTSYRYTPLGQRSGLTDPAGNVWSWEYDLLGHQTKAVDPDAGTSTSTYNDAGDVLTRTDARGSQVTYQYDTIGRPSARYDTTGTQVLSAANKLAAWTYDSVKKGYPTSATSFSGGDTYTQAVLAYGLFAAPSAVKTTLTGPDAALVPSTGYTTGYGFSIIGTPKSRGYPAGGGLPNESVTEGRDNFGEPISLTSPLWFFVSAVGYSHFGQPLQYTMPSPTSDVTWTLAYDQQTHALTDAIVTSVATGVLDKRTYNYDNAEVSKGAGLLVSTAHKQGSGGPADTQCYDYDYAQRLAAAWTATDACAATPSSGAAGTVGGPVTPYWQSWTYDAGGNRATQTQHSLAAGVGDTTTTYHYPAPGPAADQPHTLTSTTATGPGATAQTGTYGYNDAGATTSVTGGPSGNQALTWDAQGKLATVTTAAGTTTYVYDADGNLVVRRGPTSSTLFYGDEQIVLDTATGTLSGTRYYSIGGVTIAAQSSTHPTVQYLFPDRQGSAQFSVDSSAAQTAIRREYLPFGEPRGAAPTGWPGARGYTTGTPDPTTTLEILGAREYNPALGRFISPDPLLQPELPQSLNGYALANNNPTTNSDPTGLAVGCLDICPGIPNKPGLQQITTGTVGTSTPPNPSGVCAGSACTGAVTQQKAHYANGTSLAISELGPSISGYTLPGDHPDPYWLAAAVAREADKHYSSTAGYAYSIPAYVYMACNHPKSPCSSAFMGRVLADQGPDPLVDALTTGLALDISGGRPGPGVGVVRRIPGVGGRSTSCSFTADTEVLMADGTTTPIKALSAGDQVEAADAGTGQDHGANTVVGLITHFDDDLVDVLIATNGGQRTLVHTTARHPFWDATTGSWVPAGELAPGHRLQTAHGRPVSVVTVRHRPGRVQMFNLNVTQLHTYYIHTPTADILVHNECSGTNASGHPGAHQFPRTQANKSQFFDGIDVVALSNTRGVAGTLQSNGNTRYLMHGLSDVGVDKSTLLPTNIYTVIRSPDGSVLTMYPGASKRS